jgi:hypothetical protein
MTGVESEVILEIGRPKAAGVQWVVAKVSLQELTSVPQSVDARVTGQPTGLSEEGVVLGQEGTVRRRRWSQARRITLIEHPQQMADCRAAGIEAPREGSRARATPEMLVEKPASRRSGDKVGGHDGVPRAQPMAVMLRPADELVDEAHRIPGAKQVIGELVEDGTERVSPEPADMMRSVKERVEHGGPPGKEIDTPGRASELCGAVSASDQHRDARGRDVEGNGLVRTPHNLGVGIIPLMLSSA